VILTPEQLYPRGVNRPVASATARLLTTIEQVYERENTPLPTRRYLATGQAPAVDEEQISVMFGGIYLGPPGNEMTTPYNGEAPRSMSLLVQLWRRIPALTDFGNVPSAESISVASEILMHDSWLLVTAGAEFATQPGYNSGLIANAGVNEPQGEFAGVALTMEIQIP
jgi:hypothetical protein